VRLLTLVPGGFEEAAQDTVVFQPLIGAGPLDHAAQDDQRAQTALGLIIGRWDVGVAKAGAQEALAEALGPGMAQGTCWRTKPVTTTRGSSRISSWRCWCVWATGVRSVP